MSKVDIYIKNLISNDESETQEETKKKSDVIISGLFLNKDAELTKSIEERIDTVLSTFNINLGRIDEERLTKAFGLIKEVNIGIDKFTDDVFLNKLEVISKLIEIHGFGSIEDISKVDLSKLLELYNVFTGESLDKISLESVKKVANLRFSAVKRLEEISKSELSTFIDFMKKMGIESSRSFKSFKEVTHFIALLDKLGYSDGNEWLQKKEQDKINYLLKELLMEKTSSFSANTVDNIGYLFDQFSINFASTTTLVLRRKITNLKELKLLTEKDSAVLRSKIDIISRIYSSPVKMEQSDIVQVTEIFKLIGIDNRDIEETESIIDWFKGHEINLSESEIDLSNVVKQIGQISNSLEKITGIPIAKASIQLLKNIDQLTENLSEHKVEKLSEELQIALALKIKFLKISGDDDKALDFKFAVLNGVIGKHHCWNKMVENNAYESLEKVMPEINNIFKCKENKGLAECQDVDTTNISPEAEYITKICGDTTDEL